MLISNPLTFRILNTSDKTILNNTVQHFGKKYKMLFVTFHDAIQFFPARSSTVKEQILWILQQKRYSFNAIHLTVRK